MPRFRPLEQPGGAAEAGALLAGPEVPQAHAAIEGEAVSASRARKGERGVWQRRYWEHAVRDDADYDNILESTREIITFGLCKEN